MVANKLKSWRNASKRKREELRIRIGAWEKPAREATNGRYHFRIRPKDSNSRLWAWKNEKQDDNLIKAFSKGNLFERKYERENRLQ